MCDRNDFLKALPAVGVRGWLSTHQNAATSFQILLLILNNSSVIYNRVQ